jgi:histone H3/H4
MEKLSSLIKLSNEAESEINFVLSKIKEEIINGARVSCFANDRSTIERADILSMLHKLNLSKYDPYD